MQEYQCKMKITVVWPCTKISRSGYWRNIDQIMDKKVETEKTIPNNKPANIMRDNEKGTCLLLEVAIFRDSVIFTFSVKGINHHWINRWQFSIEQRKVSCVLCRMKNAEVILLVILLFSAITNGALLLSTSHILQKIYLVRCLTYISHRYFAPARSLVISSPSTYRDVQWNLIEGIHRAFIFVPVVRASIFCDQDCIFVIGYLPRSMWHITHFCWCNWRAFWRKNAARNSSWWFCSFMKMPCLTGHWQPRRNWPMCVTNFFITHPILRICPVGLPRVSCTAKTIERSPFFVWSEGHCCRGDQVGRTKLYIFFFSSAL